jgi:hypothetical protein
MKKFLIPCTLLLAALLITACGAKTAKAKTVSTPADDDAKQVAAELLTKLYTVDESAARLSSTDVTTSDITDELYRPFQSLTTDAGFFSLISNRRYLDNAKLAFDNKATLSPGNIELTQNSKDKDNVQYAFTVPVILQSSTGGPARSGSATGEIGLKRQDGDWKVCFFSGSDGNALLR